MNGLPASLDLSFLDHRQLLQVCLGEFHVQLTFDEDVSLDCESDFTLDDTRYGVRDAHALHVLLGLRVDAVSRAGRGDLRLQLGPHTLVVHDANDDYESYTLRHGTTVIVV